MCPPLRDCPFVPVARATRRVLIHWRGPDPTCSSTYGLSKNAPAAGPAQDAVKLASIAIPSCLSHFSSASKRHRVFSSHAGPTPFVSWPHGVVRSPTHTGRIRGCLLQVRGWHLAFHPPSICGGMNTKRMTGRPRCRRCPRVYCAPCAETIVALVCPISPWS